MENDDTEQNDDSSFEVLSSDEDDYTSSLYTSALQDSTFKTLGIGTAPVSVDSGMDKITMEHPTFDSTVSIDFSYLTPCVEMDDSIKSSNMTRSRFFPEIITPAQCFTENMFSEGSNYDIYKRTIEPYTADHPISSPESGNINISSIKITEKLFGTKTCNNMIDSVRNGSTSKGTGFCVSSEIQTSPLPSEIGTSETSFEKDISKGDFNKRSKNSTNTIFPKSYSGCNLFCPVLLQNSKIYLWIRRNNLIGNFLKSAKTSFSNILNNFNTEINRILGLTDKNIKIMVIADEMDVMAIKDSFLELFNGHFDITSYPKLDSITAVLPVGYSSALHAVQNNINYAREHVIDELDFVMISTATFVAETIPQCWQMSTVICLEDPVLGLNLHNFTQTVPIPNEFIHEAYKLTPDNYPHYPGLTVTLKEVVDRIMDMDTGDTQEYLTGINHYFSLKRATDLLVGMFNKYKALTSESSEILHQ